MQITGAHQCSFGKLSSKLLRERTSRDRNQVDSSCICVVTQSFINHHSSELGDIKMTFRHFLTGVLSLGFGLLFPAYGSFMAIESSGTEDDTQWLVYWLLYSLLQGFEKFAWPILQWIPLYGEVRVAVLIWLVLPQTKGATWMYEAIVGPTFQLILKEAVKIPSIDRLVNQTDLSGGQGIGSSQGAGLEQRIQQTLQGAGSALQQSLRGIQGAQDPTKKRRAEARFNKDLAKIDNISSHHSKAF